MEEPSTALWSTSSPRLPSRRPRPSASGRRRLLQLRKSAARYLGGRRVSADRFAEIAAAGRQAHTAKAKKVASALLPVIREIREAGATTLRSIAAELNERGMETPRGHGQWSAVQVQRVLAQNHPYERIMFAAYYINQHCGGLIHQDLRLPRHRPRSRGGPSAWYMHQKLVYQIPPWIIHQGWSKTYNTCAP